MEMNSELSKKVFIEVTNIEHGGEGWELGRCLWSPSRSIDKRDCWKTMRDIEKGNLIIHSVKSNKGHMFIGTSKVKVRYKKTPVEPTCAKRWAGSEYYYRVDLEDYKALDKPVYMQNFLDKYAKTLKPFKKSFFTKNLKPAQKYVTQLDAQIANILINYLGI